MPNQLSKVDIIDVSQLESLGNNRELEEIKYSSSENYFLTLAACLHFYPMLEHKEVKECIYSSLVDVFRYENGNFTMGTRQWEFTVRRISCYWKSEICGRILRRFKRKIFNYSTSI